MPLLPFRRRSKSRELVATFEATTTPGASLNETLAAQVSPAFDVTLTNGERTRRYQIRIGRAVNEWFCQVWFGELQHRGARVTGVVEAQRLQAQYRREIAHLLEDGWIAKEVSCDG